MNSGLSLACQLAMNTKTGGDVFAHKPGLQAASASASGKFAAAIAFASDVVNRSRFAVRDLIRAELQNFDQRFLLAGFGDCVSDVRCC